MKKHLFVLVFSLGVFNPLQTLCAQEVEESAEVYLEEYSDEFQEAFFEALKQKGIENHDRAINLLLECKKLQPNNIVLDYELAKSYSKTKQYILAKEHALVAVNGAPENFWYLDALMYALQRQGRSLRKVIDDIPYENSVLQENLARIYFKQRKYPDALNILKGIKGSDSARALRNKIEEYLAERKQRVATPKKQPVLKPKTSPVTTYKEQLNQLITKSNYSKVFDVSSEALEQFPSQPYFYYANGFALNGKKESKKAIVVLEMGLDYLFDDEILAKKFYQALEKAYRSLGNSSKANMYLNKMKLGS